VAQTAEPGRADLILTAPVDAATLAALPETVGKATRRVVVDLVPAHAMAALATVDRVVDGVWSLASGAEVRTDLADDLAAAASVLAPDGGGLPRW
jgi:hypothetical protein